MSKEKKPRIEAYGVKGMSNAKWRKTFKDVDALNKWVEANDAEVQGQREVEESAAVPTFTEFVGERMSTSDWRRAESVAKKSDLTRFDAACLSIARDLVKNGFSKTDALAFLAERTEYNKDDISESLVEGRTQEQAYQKVFDAVASSTEAEEGTDAWVKVARAECVAKGVPYASFKEWLEAKDFSDMKKSESAEMPDFDPAVLESSVPRK